MNFKLLTTLLVTFQPTLYPTGAAELRSERIRDIRLAEYKDGRFARHARWRYFALNSQMRWRALQEGRAYVKQNLNVQQCRPYHTSRQFWFRRQFELSDMIKQSDTQGMLFFTLAPPIFIGLIYTP